MRHRLWLLSLLAPLLTNALGPAQCAGAPYVFRTIDVPGATGTEVSGINNHGHFVGTAVRDRIGSGFVFDGDTYTTFTFPGAKHTMAKGINDQGQIVGSYGSVTHRTGDHGFLLDRGEYTALDVPDGVIGAIGEGEDINNHGQITGIFGGAEGIQAFLLDGEEIVRLTVAGAGRTEGLGLNDAGVVAGGAYEGQPGYGQWRGFTHDVDGFHFIDVGLASVSATDVNNAGQVIGWWQPGTGIDDEIRGFILDESGFMTMRVPGAAMTIPLGINDEGWIVGSYWDSEYDWHGFVATPVPEPSIWILLLGGMSCVVCLVSRRRRKNKQSADQVCLDSARSSRSCGPSGRSGYGRFRYAVPRTRC